MSERKIVEYWARQHQCRELCFCTSKRLLIWVTIPHYYIQTWLLRYNRPWRRVVQFIPWWSYTILCIKRLQVERDICHEWCAPGKHFRPLIIFITFERFLHFDWLYINDLPSYPRYSQPTMYADDTSITYASTDINCINERLNYDLNKVYGLQLTSSR